MKFAILGFLVLGFAAATTAEALALGSDLSKNELAAFGNHSVHGFWVNERTVVFFAGDEAQLNRDLVKNLEGAFASRKIVLHVGTKKAASPWDAKPRDTSVDWSVDTWDDPADGALAVPRMRMQIEIWLGSKIKLEDLRIPEGFEVVSGGEIERFVEQRRKQTK